jgi:PhoPQ-activated pathogenicity-related protein
MKRKNFYPFLFVLTILIGSGQDIIAREKLPERTALDDYVQKKDDAFSWKVLSSEKIEGMTTYVLDMTSQQWRTKKEVDRVLWQHWITIAVPDEIKSETGFVWIGGGGNGGKPPKGPNEMIQKIAAATGTVVAEISMIPNQTLTFHNDGQKRVEDDLIGYTWIKYLETGDPTWPARNPMVKAVVRAMDSVTALMKTEKAGKKTVNKFVVAGGSKRGWTTWLVGAVDKRVVGISPIVIDILNLKKSMNHHFSAYGFYTTAVGDYVKHKIMHKGKHPRMAALHAIVDPYYYRHRLKIPKFIMNGSGDQFFPPDMSRHYYDDLQGEKLLRYVPNANHSLGGTDAIESVIAFYTMVLTGKRGPQYSWTRPDDNTFKVKATDKPVKVTLWQAHNPDARDFRVESLGKKYKSTILEDQGDGNFIANVPTPEKGWTAFFVELTYDVGAPTQIKVTTNVGIVPDVFPYKDKNPILPTSLTLRFRSPSPEVTEKIKKEVLESISFKLFAEDARIETLETPEANGVNTSVNWVARGKIELSAGLLIKGLKNLGCDKVQARLESGRPHETSK